MQWRGPDFMQSRNNLPYLFLATPTIDYKLDIQHVQSILAVLSQSGGTVKPYWLCGNSNIPEARNKIAHFFLAHTPCEVMVWVDSDIIFSLQDWEYLLEGDEEIVIGPYARKILGREPVDFGLGFTRIHRSVFQKLADWMIEEKEGEGKKEALHRYLSDGELAVHYHYTGASEDMRWFGEDTGFFHWCALNGITMRKEIRCRLGHVGRMVYGYPDQIPGWKEIDPGQ